MADITQMVIDGTSNDINVPANKLDTSKYQDSSITTAKLANSSVTKAKLATDVTNEFDNLSESIADTWESGETYAVGDVRMHNNVRYKCTTANSDVTWTSSKWTAETVLEVLEDTSDEVSQLSQKVSLYNLDLLAPLSNNEHYSINGTGQSYKVAVSHGADADGDITLTIDSTDCTIAVTADDTVEEVATKIAASTITGWSLKTEGANVIMTKTTIGLSPSTITFTDTDTTGVTASVSLNAAGSQPAMSVVSTVIPSAERIAGRHIAFTNVQGQLEQWQYIGGTINAVGSWAEDGSKKLSDLDDIIYVRPHISPILTKGDTSNGYYILYTDNTLYVNQSSSYVGLRVSKYPIISGKHYRLEIPRTGNQYMCIASYTDSDRTLSGDVYPNRVTSDKGNMDSYVLDFIADNYGFVLVTYRYSEGETIYGEPIMSELTKETTSIDEIHTKLNSIEDEVYSHDASDLFYYGKKGYFTNEGELVELSSSANWLTSGKIKVSEGDEIDYDLIMQAGISYYKLGVWDTNGNYIKVIGGTDGVDYRNTGKYLVPKGVEYIQTTTLINKDIDYKSILTSTSSRINKRELPFYVPKTIYAVSGYQLRLYPYNLVATNRNDDSVDVFVDRKVSNESASYLILKTGQDHSYDVADNESINIKKRNYNGVVSVLGTSVVKKVTAINPTSKQYILCIGDSLTEYIYDTSKSADAIDRGSGAWVNELSRILCGVGDPIPNGRTSFNLSNYEVIGKRGSGTIKHEGRGGWTLDDYLHKASTAGGGEETGDTSGIPNAFYDASKSRFSLTYYLTTNGFFQSGVSSDGSNLKVVLLINWNNVYNNKDVFESNYRELINIINSEMPDTKIFIVGMNTPPTHLFKTYSGERNVSVASIKGECIRVENILQNIAKDYANVVHIPIVPYFYADGSYDTRTDFMDCPRSGEPTELSSDYVHPNLQGFGQIADIVAMGILCNL